MGSNTYKKYFWTAGILILIILIFQYFRPVPHAQTINKLPTPVKSSAVSLPWPSTGQAALGAEGYGLLASHNTSAAVPIGSTAKVITALAVLKQKPIAPGSQGPTITLGSKDVDLYNSYYAQDGSVTQVSAGEQISELQALQAMLIPSSNNMADSLADWAFGSVDNYAAYANKMVRSLGLTKTTVGGTNGFDDKTTSTADELVKLGLAALKEPVIADIVNQSSVNLPVVGKVTNFNTLLGQDGIIGIKTGNTDKAGGCYIYGAQHIVQGHKMTFVGAVLSQPTLDDALRSALPVLTAADSGFEQVIAVHKGEVLGTYKTKWGKSASFVSLKDLPLFIWRGSELEVTSSPDSIKSAGKGSQVGKVTIKAGGQSASGTLGLSDSLTQPSIFWRIVR